jgi:fatty-acyl-CoA synthase
MGTELMLLDDEDRPVAPGATGRIFVASQLRMEGYTAVVDGHFGQRLAAYVVLDPAAPSPPDADALRAHVRAHLARYKVPRDVVFLDALPRNPTGKVLKRELPAPV